MRFVIALAILSLIGCKNIDAWDCDIISRYDDGVPRGAESYLFCVNIKTHEEKSVRIEDAHGYISTDPESYGKIKEKYCKVK